MENQFQSSIPEKLGFFEHYIESGSEAVRNLEISQILRNRSLPNAESQNIPILGISAPLAISGLVGFALLIWFINSFMCICNPNEILVLSGRKYKNKDGQEVGYRVIFGGRTIRIPILETIKKMDLRTMAVPIEIQNAYSKGGTPLQTVSYTHLTLPTTSRV